MKEKITKMVCKCVKDNKEDLTVCSLLTINMILGIVIGRTQANTKWLTRWLEYKKE